MNAPPARLGARVVRAVLFDLDGTMLDTVADISHALNSALAEQGRASLSEETVALLIGRGVPTLIERAVARLGSDGARCDSARLLERFHFHYDRLNGDGEFRTRAYPGVEQGLAALNAMGLALGVVTNKPGKAATELLARLDLARWIGVVVGGDTVAHRKPHPEPLLKACEALGVTPAEALMVGDSLTDVLAARAAGLPVVCVPYGYNEGADPRALPCDALLESVSELPGLLRAAGR